MRRLSTYKSWVYVAVTKDGLIECMFEELSDAEEYIFSIWEAEAYEIFCRRGCNELGLNMRPLTYLDYMHKVPSCLLPHIEPYRVW